MISTIEKNEKDTQLCKKEIKQIGTHFNEFYQNFNNFIKSNNSQLQYLKNAIGKVIENLKKGNIIFFQY